MITHGRSNMGGIPLLQDPCPRPVEELNRAYAHVSSPSFAQAANDLKDTLVLMGFEQEEAETVIQRQGDCLGGASPSLPLAPPPLRLLSAEKPDFSDLSPSEQAQVEIKVRHYLPVLWLVKSQSLPSPLICSIVFHDAFASFAKYFRFRARDMTPV